MAVSGDSSRAASAEDVDFVAERVDVIRPTVTNDFLVSHFHLPQPGYSKFLVQLVDPVARLRLDFFPDTLQALERATVADIAGVPLRMLAADDILEHKLRLLASYSAESPAEHKHHADAGRLAAICRREIPSMPASHLMSTRFSNDLRARCPRCEASRHGGFPLAAKQAIIDVLGYV